MTTFEKLSPPKDGTRIETTRDGLAVPEDPIIPFIEGDGTGADIWAASVRVFDAAVARAYEGKRKVVWFEIYAGEKAYKKYGEWLPQDTIRAIEHFVVAIKGPLTTPVGGGIRSLNVALRQTLDLYACVRPCRYIEGVPSPVKRPEKVDMVIFREATEDVYAGIEWQEGTQEAKRVYEFLTREMGVKMREDSGIGVKPISLVGTQRLVRKAVRYALNLGRKSVTLVHKGNIMKFTEGAFRDWGYALAKAEFGDVTITEDELYREFGGKAPDGKIVIKDRITDSMFQQVLTRPDEYEVIATMNLNGDLLADAIAAQIGGLGLAPSGNIGDSIALFEATHGTAPKYAGLDKVNPGAVILSGVSMYEYLGWKEAADLIVTAMAKTIKQKVVTYDLARLMDGAKEVRCSEFATAIIDNM